MRASTEVATVATILNSQPICLKAHTPPQSQVPKSLPVSPLGTETQEPDAQDFTSSFLSEKVAVTQETATHSVVATQELAIAAIQEPAMAVTQELAADIQNIDAQDVVHHVAVTQPTADIQNLDAQDATHHVDVTQEPTTHSVTTTQELAMAETQEPTTETVTVTQSPVTLASLLQKNEFLKSELKAYKQELVIAREAYDKKLNLYTLAHVASMVEKK